MLYCHGANIAIVYGDMMMMLIKKKREVDPAMGTFMKKNTVEKRERVKVKVKRKLHYSVIAYMKIIIILKAFLSVFFLSTLLL